MKLTQTIIIGLTGLLSSLVWAKDASIQTGYFIDAPVTGLHYQTSSDLQGTTDKGAFQFRRGDVISFFLGQGEERYLLSTVSAQEVITPTAISTKPSRSINITRLLLSLDATPKDRQEILLLDEQLSDTQFQQRLKQIDLNQLVDEELQQLQLAQLASVNEAVEHLNQSQQYIEENFQSDEVIFEPLDRMLQNVIIKQRDGNGRICAYDLRLQKHPKYQPPIGSLNYKVTAQAVVEYPSIGDRFEGCHIQPSESKQVITTALSHYPDAFGTFHCANRGCTRNDLNGFSIDDFNDEGDWKYRSIAINFDPTTQLLMEKSQGLGMTDNIRHANKGELLWFTFPKEKYTQLNYQGVWRETRYQEGEMVDNCLLVDNGRIKQADLHQQHCPDDRDAYQLDVTREHADMWWVKADTTHASIEQLNLIVRWYRPRDPQPLYTTWEYLPAGKNWDKGVLYRYQQTLAHDQKGTEQLYTYSISEYVKVKEHL